MIPDLQRTPSGPPGIRRAAGFGPLGCGGSTPEGYAISGPTRSMVETLEPGRGNAAQQAVVPIMDFRGPPPLVWPLTGPGTLSVGSPLIPYGAMAVREYV